MSIKQKFHSLLLAAGVSAENFHVEELVADPIVTRPGRFWVNSTTDKVRYSRKAANGSLEILTIASEADLAAAVASLNNTIVTEISKVTQANSDEANRAIAAEQVLSDRISAEVLRATDAEVALGGRLTTELDAAKVQLNNAITTEVSRATDAETVLAGRIGNVETNYATKTEVNDRITALGNAFEYVGTQEAGLSEETAFDLSTLEKKHAGAYYMVSRAGFVKLGAKVVQVNELDGVLFNSTGSFDKIDNTDVGVAGTSGFVAVAGSKDTGFVVDLDAAFKGRVSTVEAELAAEVIRAKAAEAQLAGDVAAESARAQAAEQAQATKQASDHSAMQTALQGEVTRATGAESALDDRIVDLEAKATGAVGNLADLLTDAKENVVAAINEVQTEINAEKDLRIAQGGDFDARLQTEINARTQGDQNLLIALDAVSVAYQQGDADEAAARIAGDQAGADALAAHVVVYGNNKVATDGRIEALEAKGVSDVAALQAEIDAEESRAQTAEAGLNTRLAAVEGTFASKEQLDAKFASLGSAFEYVGDIAEEQFVGGEFNTSALTQKEAGDFYQIKGTGVVVHGAQRLDVKAGDAITFNKVGQVVKFDNTDPTVQGTADEIVVTGSIETGFVVALSGTQKTRITNLETGLADEAARAQGAETGLQAGLNAEVARAQGVEAGLQSALNAEVARAQGIETGLQTALEALDAKVANNDGSVKQLLDARVKNWVSQSPALEHTVTHSFGHDQFVYTVSVQGDDGFYRNDVVPVEYASNNAIKVTLSEARNIKVSFSSTAPVVAQ